MKLHCLLPLALVPIACAAGGIPEPVLPQGLGVNIHFVTGHEADLDRIAAAGFHFIRMDFGWASIEQQKGVYRWNEYEELLRNLEQRGIRAVFILDYSNPLYEEEVSSTNPLTHQAHKTTASPQHPDSVAAYAAWAAAAAQHFHNRGVLWELWKEPNIDFWSPKPDAGQYAAMALAAAKAIRQVDPQPLLSVRQPPAFPGSFLRPSSVRAFWSIWMV